MWVRLAYSGAGDAGDFGFDGLLDDAGQVGVEPLLQQRAQELADHVLERAALGRHGDGCGELPEGGSGGAGGEVADEARLRGRRDDGGGRRGLQDIEVAVGLDLLGQFQQDGAPIAGVDRRHAGLRRWFTDNRESFETFLVAFTDIRDLGDDRLLVIGTIHLRARGSGIETDVPTAAIATWREGLLIDWKDYGDSQEALEAVGLRE